MKTLILASPTKNKKYYFWFVGIVLLLALTWVYILSPDHSADSTDQIIDKITYRVCQNESLDPSDWERLRHFLLETEGVNFGDDLELQDYLCGRCKDCFFPKGDREIENFFKTSANYFHRKFKQSVLKKLPKTKRIKRFLDRVTNPDLGLNSKTGRIVLKNTQNKNDLLEVNLSLNNLLKP